MESNETRLDRLFQRYREACPEVEAGANFMPGLWQKIEARHNFWFVFQGLARTTATACAAICVLLLILNFITFSEPSLPAPTYTDALMADHSAERLYYTEAIRNVPSADQDSASPQH